MPSIVLQATWRDDDDMLQINVGAANEVTSASMDVYAYPGDVGGFASKLEAFPSSIHDEVLWESGSPDPKWYGHMLFRAFVLDSLGHSALEVRMTVNSAPPGRATSNFFLRCNPADLNELGRRMTVWLREPTEQLAFQWRAA